MEQDKATGFFTNVRDAAKLGGLAEDIRDAMMDCHVCPRNSRAHIVPDVCIRPRYNNTSTIGVANSL